MQNRLIVNPYAIWAKMTENDVSAGKDLLELSCCVISVLAIRVIIIQKFPKLSGISVEALKRWLVIVHYDIKGNLWLSTMILEHPSLKKEEKVLSEYEKS